MRRTPSLGTQDCHHVVRGALPVQEERTGARAEEHEPGNVHGSDRVEVHLGVQRPPEPVRGENVAAAVAYVRRHAGHGVKGLLDAGPDLLGGPATSARRAARRLGQIEQVRTLGLVELQCPGERVQNSLGHPAQIAPLETGVVVDADAGEKGDLLPAQPWDPAVAAIGGQACPIRADLCSARGQEVADLVPVVHTSDVTGGHGRSGRGYQYLYRQGLPRRRPRRV